MIVYSSIYGGYDRPKPPRPHPEVSEWRLYTDDPEIVAPGWNVVVEPRNELAHPRMQAKYRKCHPPKLGPAATSLYLDGSIRLRDPSLLDAAIEALTASDWAMYWHPERTNIVDELEASKHLRKYDGQRLDPQVTFYIDNYGRSMLLEYAGLWAAGILARRHTEKVLAASAGWWTECRTWTYQDQLSLPVVIAQSGIKPKPLTLGGGIYGNPHFAIEPHASDL